MSEFFEIDFAIRIDDKKSCFDLSKVIFKWEWKYVKSTKMFLK